MCTYNFVLRPKNDFDQDDKGLFPAEEQDSEDDVIVLIGGYYVPNDTVSAVPKKVLSDIIISVLPFWARTPWRHSDWTLQRDRSRAAPVFPMSQTTSLHSATQKEDPLLVGEGEVL